MELAQALLLLWRRKIFVALGVIVAVGAAYVSIHLLKKEGYATASTQMIVDSPRSPLGNTSASLDPFTARASVFANLMASHPAVVAIGDAAGIPANEIVATAPAAVGTTTTVSPAPPSAPQAVAPKYKLFLDQDPTLPTVDIYTQAPTTEQAVTLANASVTGFASYLRTLESQTKIKKNRRVQVRQLGAAVGGAVAPGVSKKIAAVIGLVVLLAWCAGILYVERLRRNIAERKRADAAAADAPAFADDVPFDLTAHDWSPEAAAHSPAESHGDQQLWSSLGGRRSTRLAGKARATEPVGNGHESESQADGQEADSRSRGESSPSRSNGRRRRQRAERDSDTRTAEVPDRVGALAESASAPDDR